MPAVTADTLTLPRFEIPLEAKPRLVKKITTAPQGHEGKAFRFVAHSP